MTTLTSGQEWSNREELSGEHECRQEQPRVSPMTSNTRNQRPNNAVFFHRFYSQRFRKLNTPDL